MQVYTMLYRPVSMWTLPDGVSYELVALPVQCDGFNRPDLSVSPHFFGEFTTSRELTSAEMQSFEIRRL